MEAINKPWVWTALALIIAVLLAYVLLSIAEENEAKSQVNVCVTPEQRDKLREIALESIDHALNEQIGGLFINWVKEPGVAQPKRAQTGMNNAIKAYIQAKALMIAWDPRECEAGMQLQSMGTTIVPWR